MCTSVDNGPELVIGLVGAIGVDLDVVSSALELAFEMVNYQVRQLHLIELVPEVMKRAHGPTDRRYHDRMNAGNEYRTRQQRNDALALLALAAIRDERKNEQGGNGKLPLNRCAFLLRSLKTPEEIDRLRQVYGANCYIVAAYASRDDRRTRLAQRIAESQHTADWQRFISEAERLIERDAYERKDYGQNLRGTYHRADVFLDATDFEQLKKQAVRFIDLLFGHPYTTPTRDEHAMFLAAGAALRSASAGRQVGATIATSEGDVIAVGTNEVPKAFGGQYWDGDTPDQRDHNRPADSNTSIAKDILVDLLARLRKGGWLMPEKAGLNNMVLLQMAREELLRRPMEATDDEPASLSDSAAILHLIEFIRAVHAEMAALMSAARRGVTVDGCTLYSTSFPCHECARHIVAAGIRRVVFIEPYPKSRVGALYDDSICIDDERTGKVPFRAFIGIAPRLYMRVFTTVERKDKQDQWLDWNKMRRHQWPRYYESPDAYINKEENGFALLQA